MTSPRSLKDLMRDDRTAIGTMVFEFATSGIGRIAAAAGAEFVVYDMEHTGWTGETTRTLLATTPVPAIVRVPANQYHLIAPQLDLGARGIMVPMVESAEEAQRLVAAIRYPPEGRRGAAFGIAHDDYSGGPIDDKIAASNRDILTIAQIETPAGVENVDAIAGVEGLDMLWYGQFDLSSFLGKPARFDDPAYRAAIEKIASAAKAGGAWLGALAMDVADAGRWIDIGCDCIALGGDIWIYQSALREGISDLRSERG